MVGDQALKEWFVSEVLPLERALLAFIRRNWRDSADIADMRQDIYEKVLTGARNVLPDHTPSYLFTVARHHLINCAKRARIVSFSLVANLEESVEHVELMTPERLVLARNELRRVYAGLENLPPRCREVLRLRKLEGLSTREAAERLGVGIDTIEKQMTLGTRALTDFMLGGSGKIKRPTFAKRLLRRRKS